MKGAQAGPSVGTLCNDGLLFFLYTGQGLQVWQACLTAFVPLNLHLRRHLLQSVQSFCTGLQDRLAPFVGAITVLSDVVPSVCITMRASLSTKTQAGEKGLRLAMQPFINAFSSNPNHGET